MTERYFPHPTPPDSDFNMEIDAELTTAKVPVGGLEWVKRRLEKRALNEQTTSSENVFGSAVLNRWLYLHQLGDLYEEDMRLDQPAAIIKDKEKSFLRTLTDRARELSKKLVLIAAKDPDQVTRFFSSFLQSQDDPAQCATELGVAVNLDEIDELFDEDDLEELDDKDFESEDLDANESIGTPTSDTNEELAEDIAYECSSRYMAGEELDWKISKKENIFIRLLAFHAYELFEKEKEIKNQADEFKESVQIALHKKIDTGVYTLKKEVLTERMENLEVTIVDPLLAKLNDIWGDYNSATHTIRISSSVSKTKLWGVYVHEILHSLSGKTEAVDFVDGDFEIGSRTMRSGVRMSDSLTTSAIQPHFWWLNEAITERTAQEMTGTESYIYMHERMLLQLLIDNGVTETDLRAAYFENYYGDGDTAAHPTPALKKLFDSTNEKFGPRFLVDLELCMRFGKEKKSKKTKTKPKSATQLLVAKWRKLGTEKFVEYVHTTADGIREKNK